MESCVQVSQSALRDAAHRAGGNILFQKPLSLFLVQPLLLLFLKRTSENIFTLLCLYPGGGGCVQAHSHPTPLP